MKIEILFFSFIFYSFIGWFYESTICSLVNEHRFINRGFLMGPYCPIYGVGAILCYQYFHNISNPFVLFIASMLLCSLIEYVTGYGMEKLFHEKLWDYSQFPFQLHGRICLYGALLFGLSCVLVCYFVQPVVFLFFKGVPCQNIKIAVVIIAVLFGLDVIATLISWLNLSQRLKLFFGNRIVKILDIYGN